MNPSLAKLPSLKIKSWTEESLSGTSEKIVTNGPKPPILIDEAAGSGKTTLAVKITDILNANLVHADDVSWCVDPVHWDGEMLEDIINPWLNGIDTTFRPAGWVKENRPGCIEVDLKRALVIEGVGACRKTLRDIATYSIQVGTEPKTARARMVQRDIANGENGDTVESVTKFADWWDSLLLPSLLEEESWNYVDVIVNGSQNGISPDKVEIYTPCQGTFQNPKKSVRMRGENDIELRYLERESERANLAVRKRPTRGGLVAVCILAVLYFLLKDSLDFNDLSSRGILIYLGIFMVIMAAAIVVGLFRARGASGNGQDLILPFEENTKEAVAKIIDQEVADGKLQVEEYIDSFAEGKMPHGKKVALTPSYLLLCGEENKITAISRSKIY